MFFILSKILAFIITPIIWVVVLLIWAFRTKDEIKKRKLLRWTIGLLLFFTNSFIFDEFARAWEIPATPTEKVQVYEYGIILGGASVHDEELNRVQFFRGVDRLIQAIDLYKRGHIKKIIFTGGSGRILKPDMKEAALVKPYILKMGVDENDLIIENESQNTKENARFTKAIVDSLQLKGNYLLITSAFHMRRSIACFTKAGMEVTPYSTDRYAGPRKFEFDHLFIPNVSAMYDWNNLIHEWMGYITYKLAGYI